MFLKGLALQQDLFSLKNAVIQGQGQGTELTAAKLISKWIVLRIASYDNQSSVFETNPP